MTTTPTEAEVYTDGACIGNPGPGGWAAVIQTSGEQTEISGFESDTTNNRMELTAVIRVLQKLPTQCALRLFTDSQYVQRGMTEWINNWRKNNFRKVKNPDLWRQLDALASGRNIDWQWVRGHAHCPGNIRADQLANARARQNPPTLQG